MAGKWHQNGNFLRNGCQLDTGDCIMWILKVLKNVMCNLDISSLNTLISECTGCF